MFNITIKYYMKMSLKWSSHVRKLRQESIKSQGKKSGRKSSVHEGDVTGKVHWPAGPDETLRGVCEAVKGVWRGETHTSTTQYKARSTRIGCPIPVDLSLFIVQILLL